MHNLVPMPFRNIDYVINSVSLFIIFFLNFNHAWIGRHLNSFVLELKINEFSLFNFSYCITLNNSDGYINIYRPFCVFLWCLMVLYFRVTANESSKKNFSKERRFCMVCLLCKCSRNRYSLLRRNVHRNDLFIVN